MQNKHINQKLNKLTQIHRDRNRDMKEAVMGRSGGGGGVGRLRSESEKEKTKLRERQRRAITTKIFHGLRKWGGYHLSPRADINEVLRELAKEAGWVIEPDGTTYHAKLMPGNPCPACGCAAAAPTPSSSIVIGNGGGGGGDCSTSTSPPHVSLGGGEPMINSNMTANFLAKSGGFADIPLSLYIYGTGGLPNNGSNSTTTTSTSTSSTVYCDGGGGPVAQQPFYLQEVRASNHNTPAGSPLHRPT